jgi:hypothetical protein
VFGSLTELKQQLGIILTDNSEDVFLNQLLTQWSQIIEDYCDRKFYGGTFTEYFSGNGTQFFFLNQRPVALYILQGANITITNGSTSVTGLPTTGNNGQNTGVLQTLANVVGMPISHAQIPGGQTPAIVPGTTISAVGSGTITLSQNAQASASGANASLACGVAVWQDDNGYWRGPSNAFSPGTTQIANTQLICGTDWMLDIDQPDGVTSVSGRIINISTGVWDNQWQYHPGTIVPFFQTGLGDIYAQYTNALTNANTLVASSIVQANAALYAQIAWIRNSSQYGQQLNNESYGDGAGTYAYGLGGPEPKIAHLCPIATGILSRLRNVAVA